MDAYAIAAILGAAQRTVLYYAGMAHTTAAEAVLRECGFADQKRGTPLGADAKRLSAQHGITHFRNLARGRRAVILIGEVHPRTGTAFGAQMLDVLRRECAGRRELLFLVEKHIFGEADALQQRLACNQADLALHSLRCDPWLTRSGCESLQVVAVDNRHVDMGFLRAEILDAYAEDAAVREAAVRFHEACVRDILLYCEMRMLHISMSKKRRMLRRAIW